MFLCQCWKCRDLDKVWESLGMALHVERAATVHEVHVRAFFSDTARAHSEMSRSRIIFLAHMIQQQSACIQCIHDRPNISQHLCIIYSFICFIQKHPETWSSFFWLFPFGCCCVCQTQLREFWTGWFPLIMQTILVCFEGMASHLGVWHHVVDSKLVLSQGFVKQGFDFRPRLLPQFPFWKRCGTTVRRAVQV